MKKRAVSLLMAMAMAAMLLVPANAAGTGFSDVSARHYARESIQFWTERGVLSGYPDGTFRPGGSMTRAEMAVLLQNVMGYRDRAENVWTDLPQKAWYTDSILALASRGVLSGTGKGKMSPKTTITRQEAFVMLSNALGIEPQEGVPGFADDSQIASWAVGYVTALKNLGYIHGYAGANTIRPTASITRAETVSLLSQLVPGYVSENGVYSTSCPGTLLVKAGNVTLKDMTVEGDLIVTEAVGEGDVYLEGVTVRGDIVLYGCGENSFHLLPGCKVDKIIVTKTTGGRIRVVNESGETIPLIWVNDGTAGVTLDGDHLGEVVVACDAPVAVKAKTVGTLSVTGNANLTVSKESTVASLEVASTAGGAKVNVEGKVTALVNDGGANVVGVAGSGSGSGSGGGSSGGSGSGGGSVTPPTQKTTLNEASIQLLAPAFGEIPDTADPLGAGFTTQIKWLNADGSAPSYRWSDPKTFTANQAYKAVVTLIPTSRYEFADALQVTVTDGNGNNFTPATSEKKGDNWELTLVYPATAAKDYLESCWVSGDHQMTFGTGKRLTVWLTDNLLVDPATHTYQWYTCDAGGGALSPIAGATGTGYDIPGDTAPGLHYYCFKVTAGGKEYTSASFEVEVKNALEEKDVLTPVIEDARLELRDGRLILGMTCSNAQEHPELRYVARICNGEWYSRTFEFGADWNVGCWSNVTNTDAGTTFEVESVLFGEHEWSYIFEDLMGTSGGNDLIVPMDFADVRVEVTPALRQDEYQYRPLESKKAEKQFDGTVCIHYVVGTRERLQEQLSQYEDMWCQEALAGYPKDGIRWVMDNLDNGDGHLELVGGSQALTDPARDRYSVLGILKIRRGEGEGYTEVIGTNSPWNNVDWALCLEYGLYDMDRITKIDPEVFFFYRSNIRDVFIYRVVPEFITDPTGNT